MGLGEFLAANVNAEAKREMQLGNEGGGRRCGCLKLGDVAHLFQAAADVGPLLSFGLCSIWLHEATYMVLMAWVARQCVCA